MSIHVSNGLWFYSCWVALLLLSACEPRDYELADWEERPTSVPCPPTAQPTTLVDGQLSYDHRHVFCIDVQMDAADFDRMRYESRFGPDTREQDGVAARRAAFQYVNQCDVPFPNYFQWYRANLTIDGLALEEVGIRKKGFLGSIFSTAPSIKIHTAHHRAAQHIGGTTRLMFNNNAEDPTRVVQCLFYRLFEWAGQPAARTNLANLSVNGEPLGAYTHVEPIDAAFLERVYGNSTGHLYECQLTDFRPHWLSRWEAKTEHTDPSFAPLADIARVLKKSDDATLVDDLRPYLNVEDFIRFWALEILINHRDGYCRNSNNTYVYFNPDDGGRATFIPAGLNYYKKDDVYTHRLDEFATAELPRRLSRCPEAAALLEDELYRLLNRVWNEADLLALLQHFEGQLHHIELDESTQNGRAYYLNHLRDWIDSRRRLLRAELAAHGLPVGAAQPSFFCHAND